MELFKYKIEWSLLFVALVSSIVSLYLDIQLNETNTCEGSAWFSRSGAVLVLFAAIVEYRLSSYLFDDIHKAAVKNAVKNQVIGRDNNKLLQSLTDKKPEPPKSRATLALISHVFIVMGTFIWGYSDLVIK